AGAGTLSLTNANTYAGGTVVSAGTLLAMNTSGSGTGTGAVVVNSGGELGGTGIVAGNVISSGTVAPGSSAGTLRLGGSYSQGAGGTLAIELASTANYDVLDVTGDANLSGTLVVALMSGFVPQEHDTFEIVTAA